MRKVLWSLTVVLVVGFFVGCSGGRGGDTDTPFEGLYINENSYYPDFKQMTTKVEHSIQRFYQNKNDRDSAVDIFQKKGAYSTYMDVTTRYNPLSNVALSSTTVYSDSYDIFMRIEINGADVVNRNDELFKTIFGDTDAPIIDVLVTKYFASNITSKLKEYGKSLVNDGFKPTSDERQWWKQDLTNHITSTWTYTSDGKTAMWETSKTDRP
jgi:hypothetical protein